MITVRKLSSLMAIAVIVVVAVALMPPIAQAIDYHEFADQRTLWGVPNFWNAVSNIPFLLVGWAGLRELAGGTRTGTLRPLRAAYVVFFASAGLIALGSGFYHWAPDNKSLVWDRLPMTLGFMAFFTIIIGEHIGTAAGARLFYPLLALGVIAVAYWHLTEQAGHGDLRPYIVVQFLPMLLIPLIVYLFPARFSHVRFIWAVVALYACAKLLELADGWIYAQFNLISGHTLKHVAAALGMYCFLYAVRHRLPVNADDDAHGSRARSMRAETAVIN